MMMMMRMTIHYDLIHVCHSHHHHPQVATAPLRTRRWISQVVAIVGSLPTCILVASALLLLSIMMTTMMARRRRRRRSNAPRHLRQTLLGRHRRGRFLWSWFNNKKEKREMFVRIACVCCENQHKRGGPPFSLALPIVLGTYRKVLWKQKTPHGPWSGAGRQRHGWTTKTSL